MRSWWEVRDGLVQVVRPRVWGSPCAECSGCTLSHPPGGVGGSRESDLGVGELRAAPEAAFCSQARVLAEGCVGRRAVESYRGCDHSCPFHSRGLVFTGFSETTYLHALALPSHQSLRNFSEIRKLRSNGVKGVPHIPTSFCVKARPRLLASPTGSELSTHGDPSGSING